MFHRTVLVVACTMLLVAGCSPTTGLTGRATSMLFNPERVGGLPVGEGPSGPRPDAPAPVGNVENTDGGAVDQLALLAVNDIEDYWNRNYAKYLPGNFSSVGTLFSYDSDDPNGPLVCGVDMYQQPNAAYCFLLNVLMWDRGVFLPVAREYFGDMGVVGAIAHEYGHAVQWMAGLVDADTESLMVEQQADCFAGVYLRSVAAGESSRFTLSTGDGLNRVLAGGIFIRDRPSLDVAGDAHGSALDRVSAFQMGFTGNAEQCAQIDMAEIEARQGDLPEYMSFDIFGTQVTDSPISDGTLSQLMDVLSGIFKSSNPPTLTTDPNECASAASGQPTAYCPATNAIYVDLPALQAAGEPKSEQEDEVLLQGDNTAFSMVTSRYALAVEHQRGVPIDTPVAALRTACLTGMAQSQMTDSDGALTLSPGDTDEAVSGLLTNGLVASDVNAMTVPAGFTRILAYRLGLSSDAEECFQRFA
jgi:predicted metalloprotease